MTLDKKPIPSTADIFYLEISFMVALLGLGKWKAENIHLIGQWIFRLREPGQLYNASSYGTYRRPVTRRVSSLWNRSQFADICHTSYHVAEWNPNSKYLWRVALLYSQRHWIVQKICTKIVFSSAQLRFSWGRSLGMPIFAANILVPFTFLVLTSVGPRTAS